MSAIITRPTNMEITDWADSVVSDLRQYGVIGGLLNPDDWRNWGAQLLNNTSLGNILPDPYQFADWRLWADRLCNALS